MGESFSQLEERAKRATTIEELFCLWKRAHAAEVKEGNWEKTCPFDSEQKARENFTRDGRLGDAQEGGVLFICKESNLSKDENTDEKSFWMRENVQQNDTPAFDLSQAKRARTLYRNRLKDTLDKLHEKGYGIPDHLEECAYMNLNKRGGFSRTRYTILKEYVRKYKCFLTREIELLAPDVVVFCGCYDGVAEQLFSVKDEEKRWNKKPVSANLSGKTVTLYYVYHPAYSRFKDSLEWI